MWCERLEVQEEARDAETLTPLPSGSLCVLRGCPYNLTSEANKSSSGDTPQSRGQET